MSEQCLELKNVCKSFRDFTLNNISFTLPQGYIMGLVGPNGAGKTTTIQLILNMLEKDAGRILAFGKDNVVSEKEIKQDIGIVFDSIFYVDSWTVKDTEKAVSIFYDNWRHDIFNDMVKRFDLPLNKKVGELSRGMHLLVPADQIAFVEKAITEGTNGRAKMKKEKDLYYSVIDGEVKVFTD